MSEPVIRPWEPGDVPQLKALWRIAFGDSEEYIDSFFSHFLRKDACLVAEADGQAVSAMYILPGESVFPHRKNVLSAGYVYALATLPEYRSRGIGSAVYRAASGTALLSADAACVLPAEKGLYPFYETSGARPFSFLREARISRDELAGTEPRMAARFPALRYAGMRERILSGLPHAVFPDSLFEFMEENGTEFFILEQGLAAAETEGGVCRILELLDTGDDAAGAIAGVARWCRAEEYIVRTPLFFDGPGEPRPFMLAALKREPDYPLPDDLWWGFGLD